MESTYIMTSTAASCAAPVSSEVRTWVRPVRRILVPTFASAQGTGLPISMVPTGPAVTGGSNAHIRERNVVTYLPTVEKQQATNGVVFGAIPVRTWSPPV